MKRDLIDAATTTPAVGVSGMLILGVPLSDWVLIGTALLIILQIFVLVRDKLVRPYNERKQRKRSGTG